VTTEAQQAQEQDAWALESGLPNDVDGWMKNNRFGTKEEYAQAVKLTVEEAEQQVGGVAGLMFITDLYNEDGEQIGSQGFSVGSGWIPSEDGKSMHHPTRKNVVDSSRYGQLQRRVIKELGVNMSQYGVPTQADSWDNLGFHWMLEEHVTIQGKEPKRGIMPTIFLGKKEIKGAPAAEAPKAGEQGTKLTGDVEAELKKLLEVSPNVSVFQKAALKIEAVTKNDDLMADILNDGPDGYYERNRPK
jgi:hypothetical protein